MYPPSYINNLSWSSRVFLFLLFKCLWRNSVWMSPVPVLNSLLTSWLLFHQADEMHMNITHLPLILRFISLLSVSPTGPGSNPNSGSGLQSGVWILAGCQRRYAWSPLPGTGGVWRMSENVFLLFPLLPHCCYSLHLLCTSSFLLLSSQTAILSFILMFLAQHTNIHFLSGLGLDILKTGSCETPERRSAVLDSQRCSYLTYTLVYIRGMSPLI